MADSAADLPAHAIDLMQYGLCRSAQDLITHNSSNYDSCTDTVIDFRGAEIGECHRDYTVNQPPIETANFLGLGFDILEEDEVVRLLAAWAKQDTFTYIVTPNAAHAVWYDRARSNDWEAALAYDNADLTLCDSRIISLLARWSGIHLPLVTGSDLTKRLLSEGGPWSRLAVVGGTAEMHVRLAAIYPQFTWFFNEPPQGLIDNPGARAQIATFVEETRAELVFLAFGAPQSELCCYEISQRDSASGVGLCVGASLEFLTGIQRRAPGWMQRSRLEWLHRLLSDPPKMWKRYAFECPRIFKIWLKGSSASSFFRKS